LYVGVLEIVIYIKKYDVASSMEEP
jgi:hypothetical protein